MIEMDKITRMLLLYHTLMAGRPVNKYTYAMDYGIGERSFDRDIQAMRVFLSDSFSNQELIYDANQHCYRLEHLQIKKEIAIGECYILSKLLLDSRPLRTDDQNEILQILLSQLTPTARERVQPVLTHMPDIPICLDKASVKLIEDLLFSIERRDRITLQFEGMYPEVCCVPYSVEFCSRSAYLVGWGINTEKETLYPLDDILSYLPGNHPYALGTRQETALRELVAKVCNAARDEYKSFIYQKGSA